ncbi:DDE-domain-containing protein [Sporormia fimetaria CBS 119925]|uniref:DDE-domain-containing protein n=1 Tax=Sporormia fimetaria CBS 119925 TaxID=1340428 RepID=A0A6A6UXF2_9PLEO|nr:DDE-domain-containing protein [Sporormia fimetaria CBS 119925]
MIRNFASQVAKNSISDSWVTRFIKRHSIHLISQWTAGMDNNRHKADSETKYSLYFDLLRHKITEYNIEARHTYNMDEKGFLIGIISRSKRVFSRRMWEEKEVRAAIQDGSCEWITLLACVCADGSALPPGLIYQAADNAVQSRWVEAIKPGEHSVHVTSSPSGWTNHDIGLAWLEQVFDRYTKEKARRSYRLLILDGHGSHVSMDFIEYCDQNKILLAVFPPHSTHTLQPLDVLLFKPLSTAYSTELSNFLHKSQGLLPIKKGDFFPLFWKAWVDSFKNTTILKSFEATGIAPIDPDILLKRFTNTALDEQESRESSTSALSPSDWRKMERLVRVAVKDRDTEEAKRLSRSLHSLQVQNELLHHENDGLREALAVKKKHKKHGKRLDLQQRKEYHGGAVFWSPRKVREARARQDVKEREDKEIQLQKSKRAEERRAAKIPKEKERQEKQKAKVVMEKEKAEQAAERARQKEAQNAEKSLKLPQKGKRPTSKPPRGDIKQKKQVVEPAGGGEASDVVLAAPSVTTRRGRNVTLPDRYK